jgi:L-threonylcarbamoyladenylate synthase
MKLDASDPRLSERLAELFAAGGVAIMPCDTIYGIVGPAPASEARIRELKGRGEKSFLQLIAGADWLERFGRLTLPPTLAAYWPGPLTLIFPAGEGSVALRVPADSRLRLLLERLGRPLYSTSVNRSGQPALWRSAEKRPWTWWWTPGTCPGACPRRSWISAAGPSACCARAPWSCRRKP